jgi:hypothetical protein
MNAEYHIKTQIIRMSDATPANKFLLLHDHKQGLGLKTCSFEAVCVLGPSISSWVFPPAVFPEVCTEKLVLVSGFGSFFASDQTVLLIHF